MPCVIVIARLLFHALCFKVFCVPSTFCPCVRPRPAPQADGRGRGRCLEGPLGNGLYPLLLLPPLLANLFMQFLILSPSRPILKVRHWKGTRELQPCMIMLTKLHIRVDICEGWRRSVRQVLACSSSCPVHDELHILLALAAVSVWLAAGGWHSCISASCPRAKLSPLGHSIHVSLECLLGLFHLLTCL
jgi:hypothetical protein